MSGFFERMRDLLGDEGLEAFRDALSRPVDRYVRWNSRRCDPHRADGTPVPWCSPWGRRWEHESPPSGSLDYAAGHYYIQEASAMLAVQAAQSVTGFSGKRVLDLCASPGGKSTQAAESAGLLVANEVIRGRIPPLVWNLIRHRTANTVVTCLDPAALADMLTGWFEVALVDAPCSGEGLMARGKLDADAWKLRQVLFCAERQRSILRQAVELLAPDGLLAYSTCTFAPEENEHNVAFLLELGMIPERFPDSMPASPAYTTDERIAACSRRLYPHTDGGAGAFVALLRKPSDAFPGVTPRGFRFSVPRRAPDLIRMPEAGRVFELRGELRHLDSEANLPVVLVDRAVEVGIPVYRDKPGWMQGAVSLAADGALLPLDEATLARYIRGEDLRTTEPDGWRFPAWNGIPLGLVKISGGRAANRYPEPLRVR